MLKNKQLILHCFLIILEDLATISIFLYELCNQGDNLKLILLPIAYVILMMAQQLSHYVQLKTDQRTKLLIFTFIGKTLTLWFASISLGITQNLIIIHQVIIASEYSLSKLLNPTFAVMLVLNVFEFRSISNFQYNQLVNLIQIAILAIECVYYSPKIDESYHQQHQSSLGAGQAQQTFGGMMESKRSVPIIMSLKSSEEQPWLDQKWLFYEKYLVLNSELQLKFYSFDPNLLVKTLDITENIDSIVTILLDQSVKFLSRIDNSQQSMQCIKGTYTLRQVIQNQHSQSINSEYYYQTFQMQSSLFDVQKYLINVFGLAGAVQNYLILHFQIIPKLANEINTNIFDMCKSLSHELGTNLNCIQSLSELAINSPDIDQYTIENIIKPILTNSQQLNLIISNIRDYSSIELEQFQLGLSQFNLKDEIKHISDFFLHTCREKNIIFELPQENGTITNYLVFLFNDRERFKQATFQLVSNAVRFTQSGTIKISVKYKDMSYVVAIKDSGIGMTELEENNLRRILDNQIMLRVSTHSIGSSLGLFISNLLVKKLNADEEAKIEFSTNKKGSEFYFSIRNMSEFIDSIGQMQSLRQSKTIIKFQSINSYIENYNDFIPKRQVTTAFKTICSGINAVDDGNYTIQSKEFDENRQSLLAIPSLIPQLQDSIQVYSLKSSCCSRVLIVDDEYFNIMTLEMIMKKFDSICDKAYNGKEALEQIRQKLNSPCPRCLNNCYQLILLDINMPIMGGFETVIEIKRMMKQQIIKKVCVLANTGFSDLETKEKAYDAGMDYFMTKPLDIPKFKGILQRIFPIG